MVLRGKKLIWALSLQMLYCTANGPNAQSKNGKCYVRQQTLRHINLIVNSLLYCIIYVNDVYLSSNGGQTINTYPGTYN